jgi:hypothetical protein
MIKRVSLAFFRLRRKPAALDSIKESAPRTWDQSREARP